MPSKLAWAVTYYMSLWQVWTNCCVLMAAATIFWVVRQNANGDMFVLLSLWFLHGFWSKSKQLPHVQ